ncbi:MAG TPA: histidinol-phosphate transaminase [Saprospiraceae bacterium]|nr:histidinol-phosphate transaminase [Saprospiraceae bacterium]
MSNLSRRRWLRTAGLFTGSLPFAGLSGKTLPLESFTRNLHHLPPGISVKLNANENPYGPSSTVRQAITSAFDKICRYPWAEVDEVRQKVAAKLGVSPDHVLLTVGSTEGLKITSLALGLHEGEIIAGSPTFEAMLRYSEAFGGYVNRVPTLSDDNLSLDLDEMERRITSNTRLVFLCNPNNPTGGILPAARLRDFCETVSGRTVVFCDEAYIDYVTEPGYPSMVELVKKGANVIVARTFSKVYGMAGIRIGYLVARPDLIRRIDAAQIDAPNMLALHAAAAALDDQEFYRFSLRMNAEGKDLIYQTLDTLKLPYVRSHANFVFFKTGRDISGVMRDMRAQGVEVGRPFPPLTDWCRVSTGKLEDLEVLRQGMMKVFG